jgi:hypothetical protein
VCRRSGRAPRGRADGRANHGPPAWDKLGVARVVAHPGGCGIAAKGFTRECEERQQAHERADCQQVGGGSRRAQGKTVHAEEGAHLPLRAFPLRASPMMAKMGSFDT